MVPKPPPYAEEKPLEQRLPEFWKSLYDNLRKVGFNYDEAWKLLMAYVQSSFRTLPPEHITHFVQPMPPFALPAQQEPLDVTPRVTCSTGPQ